MSHKGPRGVRIEISSVELVKREEWHMEYEMQIFSLYSILKVKYQVLNPNSSHLSTKPLPNFSQEAFLISAPTF